MVSTGSERGCPTSGHVVCALAKGLLVAVRHVRLTAGGFWPERKSQSGNGRARTRKKNSSLTEAQKNEITARLLAKWSAERDAIRDSQRGPQLGEGRRKYKTDAPASRSPADATVAKRPSRNRVPGGSSNGVSRSRNRAGGPGTKQLSGGRSLIAVNPKAASWWAPANGKPAREVYANMHVLAWWRCPRGKHPQWQEYIDVVAHGRGYCPRCGSLPARPKSSTRRGTVRKRAERSRTPEPTPYERAFGTSPLLRQLNPPEAIRDAWR
jgi:hypothetical protein